MDNASATSRDLSDTPIDERKIFMKGLPKYYAKSELKNFLTDKEIMGYRLNYGKSGRFSVVYKTIEEKNDCLERIEKTSLTFKKFTLTTDSYTPKVKERKRKISQKPIVDKMLTQQDLVEKICPLFNTSYEEQLKIKKAQVVDAVSLIKKTMKKVYNATVTKEVSDSWLASVTDVVRSPVLEKYRNKVELNVFQSSADALLSIGFRVGRQRDFAPLMLPEEDYIFNPLIRKIAPILLEILQESMISCDGIIGIRAKKNWKMVSIRTPTTGLYMLTFELEISEFVEELNTLESFLKKLVKEKIDMEALGLVSVNVRYSSGPGYSSDVLLPMVKNLIGVSEIHEELLDHRFNISSESFFQTNTKGAEQLYQKIRDLVIEGSKSYKLNNSIVLDICCGTGTIALIIANYVKCVYGVEICSDAVKNAEINANLNGIENTFFVCGDVSKVVNDDWIAEIFAKNNATEEPLIAILDPPRAGVDISVICCLKSCDNVKRILYVACNPPGITKNISCLIKPKTKSIKGDPFNLVKIIPIDMFPHTRHCEAIFVLER